MIPAKEVARIGPKLAGVRCQDAAMLGTTNASTCVSNPSSMATMPPRMNIFHCADWIGAASRATPISLSPAAESCSLILRASYSARALEFDTRPTVQRSQPTDRVAPLVRTGWLDSPGARKSVVEGQRV